MKKGKFIVFEGADGSGTTSQAERLRDNLSRHLGAPNVLVTAEPSCGPVGKFIQKILSGDKEVVPSSSVMELLFRADRINHLESRIRPALEVGRWVICDRYYPSTLVYQGIRDSQFKSMLAMVEMHKRFIEDDKIDIPDLTIFLSADLEIMAQRRQDRGKIEGTKEDIYEDQFTQIQVIRLYEVWKNATELKDNRVTIDANEGMEKVADACFSAIKRAFFDGE